MGPDHPSCNPARAPLWDAFLAFLGSISALIAPAGNGSEPLLLDDWRAVRRRLAEAERRFRRLILPEAMALAARLTAGLGPLRQRARPARARSAETRARARPLFHFSLHEATPRPSHPRPGRQHHGLPTPPLRDHFGTTMVPARAEFRRYAALIAATQSPGHTILRLARILRRRAGSSRPPLPFRPDGSPRRMGGTGPLPAGPPLASEAKPPPEP